MTALRAIFAIGLALLWLLFVAPPVFMTPPSAYTGTHLLSTGAPVQPQLVTVKPGSPAYLAGLRTGDVLGCLSVYDATVLLHPLQVTPAYRPQTPITTCVQRGGTMRTIRFFAKPARRLSNFYGSPAIAVLRICVVLVFFLTGIALLLLRPSLMTWIFYIYCLCSAPAFASGVVWTVLPPWQYTLAAGIPELGALSAVSFLLLFAVLVPDNHITQGWRRTAFFLTAALAVAWTVFGLLRGFDTSFTISNSLRFAVDETLTVVTVLLVVARLLTMHRSERARFGWAAFAIIFGVITNDLRNVFAIGSEQWLSVTTSVLTVVMPIALIYAILKRHVIDVRFVLSRTVVYAVITTFVVGLIGAVDWASSAYLHEARFAMALDALVTIALGFLLHRTYRWLEYAVDFFLFRRKHEGEAYLQRLARTLAFAQDEAAIDRALVDGPCDKFDLSAAALYRQRAHTFAAVSASGWDIFELPSFGRGEDVVRFLMAERAWVDMSKLHQKSGTPLFHGSSAPSVALPIFEGNTLTGFTLYALHRDGTKLDPDEMETLERLCDAAAQAYTGIELAQYRSAMKPAVALEALS